MATTTATRGGGEDDHVVSPGLAQACELGLGNSVAHGSEHRFTTFYDDKTRDFLEIKFVGSSNHHVFDLLGLIDKNYRHRRTVSGFIIWFSSRRSDRCPRSTTSVRSQTFPCFEPAADDPTVRHFVNDLWARAVTVSQDIDISCYYPWNCSRISPSGASGNLLRLFWRAILTVGFTW